MMMKRRKRKRRKRRRRRRRKKMTREVEVVLRSVRMQTSHSKQDRRCPQKPV
jgi:hypothetical protein